MDRKGTIYIAAAIFLGMVAGAWVLGRALQRFRNEERYITVKGFSEREVKADLAVWSVKARVVTNDLSEGSRAIDESKDKVVQFLLKNGIKPEEIVPQDLVVNDRQATEYGSSNVADRYRYVIEKAIQVRSGNVDNVLKVSRMTDDLLKAGVALSTTNDWRGTGLKFIFTGLNGIKPEMVSEATRNARKAAVEFTKESKTHLGKMKQASQGLFSIMDRDEFLSGQGEGGYSAGSSDLFKKVRVVITVEYSIW
jgi:uncharacterized protein